MTDEQFNESLDKDLSWRKKELSELFLFTKSNDKKVLLKSCILLLYAHWEGYVKNSSKLYLKYISEKKIRLDLLTGNFHAIIVKGQIKGCMESYESLTLSNEIKFIEKLSERLNQNFKLNIKMNDHDRSDKQFIDTESNLNSEVFRNILNVIGLNYKNELETRKNYIETFLLNSRNAISHGSKIDDIDLDEFSLEIGDVEKLKNVIFFIIDCFTEELKDYIEKEYYLTSNLGERNAYEESRMQFLSDGFKELSI